LFWTWEREFSLRCKVQFGTIKFQQEFFFTKMMRYFLNMCRRDLHSEPLKS